jgi:hypothetical protein
MPESIVAVALYMTAVLLTYSNIQRWVCVSLIHHEYHPVDSSNIRCAKLIKHYAMKAYGEFS